MSALVLRIACACVLLFGSQAARAQQVTVLDGDTLELAGRVIDLVGIDAPAFGQLCRRGGVEVDCGMIARTQLLDLTAGATVSCDLAGAVVRAGWPTIAACQVGGYDLSEGMLHTGWALAPPDDPVSQRYASVQAGARDARRGLWGFEFVPPWDWRQGVRLNPGPAPQ